MQTKKIALIPILTIVLITLTLSVVTAGVLISQQNVPSAGTIGGKITSTVYIGVYSDPAMHSKLHKHRLGQLKFRRQRNKNRVHQKQRQHSRNNDAVNHKLESNISQLNICP